MYEGESRTILQDTYSPASGAKHTTPDDQSVQWQTEKRPSTCFFNQLSIFDVAGHKYLKNDGVIRLYWLRTAH